MEPITRERLAANPYRTLGLGGSAGQAAIESAARRMRIWPDPARIPPTPWDLPSLGPLARARGEIERAVARLSEPATRVEDRLLWYLGSAPPAPGAPTEPRSLVEHHDAALAALHAVTAADAATPDAEAWRGALSRFREQADSRPWVDWLKATEAAGDFEKRASGDEVRRAAEALPDAVAGACAAAAQAALAAGQEQAAVALLALLGSGGNNVAGAAPTAPVRDMLDRFEDAIEVDVRAMDGDLRDRLRTNRQDPEPFYFTNREASYAAARVYNERIDPALQSLAALAAAADPDRLTRVRSRCSATLALLGMGWEWAGQFVTAEGTLRLALSLAGDGTAAATEIRNDLARLAPLAANERAGVRRVVPRPARPAPAKPTPAKRGTTARAGWAAAAIAVALLRLIGSLSSDSGSNAPSYNNTYQYRTPPVMPDLRSLTQDPQFQKGSDALRLFEDIEAFRAARGRAATQPTTTATAPAESFGEEDREH